MDNNRKRRGVNWSGIIGWIIFMLIIAGGPILRLVGQLFNGTVTLSTAIGPFIVGAAILLTIIVGAIRATGTTRSRRDTRLPTSSDSPARPPNAPMPPFSNGPSSDRPSLSPSVPRPFNPPDQSTPQVPNPLRFDPVINPVILAAGVVGLFLLVGAGLFVIAQRVP